MNNNFFFGGYKNYSSNKFHQKSFFSGFWVVGENSRNEIRPRLNSGEVYYQIHVRNRSVAYRLIHWG